MKTVYLLLLFFLVAPGVSWASAGRRPIVRKQPAVYFVEECPVCLEDFIMPQPTACLSCNVTLDKPNSACSQHFEACQTCFKDVTKHNKDCKNHLQPPTKTSKVVILQCGHTICCGCYCKNLEGKPRPICPECRSDKGLRCVLSEQDYITTYGTKVTAPASPPRQASTQESKAPAQPTPKQPSADTKTPQPESSQGPAKVTAPSPSNFYMHDISLYGVAMGYCFGHLQTGSSSSMGFMRCVLGCCMGALLARKLKPEPQAHVNQKNAYQAALGLGAGLTLYRLLRL